jgi:predicted MFS family arabinose efflux permease
VTSSQGEAAAAQLTVSGEAPSGGQRLAIGSAIVLGVLCALVANTLPVFLVVLGRTLSLNEAQVGYVALADLGGIAIGSVMCAMLPSLITRFGWRPVAMAGMVLLIIGNTVASQAGDYAVLLASRLLAGTGAGFTMAIVYAVLAGGNHPARNLALFNVFQLASAAIGVQYLSLIASAWGAQGLFLLISALSALGAGLCYFLPRSGCAETTILSNDNSTTPERISGAGWLAIFAALLHFIGTGAIFGFLAYMGIAWGGDPSAVESSLSTVMLAAIAAAVISAIVGARFHYMRPLLAGYVVLLVATILLFTVQPVGQFVVFASLFGFGWNIVMPFQFAAITHADNSDSTAMLINASTLGGVAIGPAIAGNYVTSDYGVIIIGSFVALAMALGLLLLALKWHRAEAAAI